MIPQDHQGRLRGPGCHIFHIAVLLKTVLQRNAQAKQRFGSSHIARSTSLRKISTLFKALLGSVLKGVSSGGSNLSMSGDQAR